MHKTAWTFAILWAKLCLAIGALVAPDAPMKVDLTPPAASKQIAPLRQGEGGCPRLKDIDSQIGDNIYRDSDPVTWGHETCHGIASRIRQIEGPRTNGFYLFDNQYIAVKEIEGLTLAELAASIPQSVRKGLYQLYLVDQRKYWNNEPTYVLDEAFAYLNGTVVGLELELFGEYWEVGAQRKQEAYPVPMEAKAILGQPQYSGLNRTKDSFVRAQEMVTYSVYLSRAAAQQDITEAVHLLCQRTADVAKVIGG